MTTTTDETIDHFRYWSEAVRLYGDELTEATGDVIHTVASGLAAARVIDASAVLSEELPAAEVQQAQALLDTYAHVADPLLADLASTGWLEVVSCSCDGCDSLTYAPGMPAWGWLLFQLDDLRDHTADLTGYVESLGGSPDGFRQWQEENL